ncbi:MAG: MBL fold metallo-hydrolase [Candidatus Helarchaeota archaeon]
MDKKESIYIENIAEKLVDVSNTHRNPIIMPNRREKNLTVVILGTGIPAPDIYRSGSAAAIIYKKHCLIVDCGRWVSRQVILANIRFEQIKGVLLTHLHQDHLNGFPCLWMDAIHCRRDVPWHIWGPVGTKECMDALKVFNKIDLEDRINANLPVEGFEINVTEFDDEYSWELGGIKITAVPVDHWVNKLSFGFRFDTPEKSIIYSGDTRKCHNLIELGKRGPVDVLVHEICMEEFADFVVKAGLFHKNADPKMITQNHTSIPEMIEIANEIKPRKLVLTHVVPNMANPNYIVKKIKEGYDGEVICANDLDSF